MCTLQDLDAAAFDLAEVTMILLDVTIPAGGVRAAVSAPFSTDALEDAIGRVPDRARPPADTTYESLVNRYRRVSGFCPRLLATLQLDAIPMPTRAGVCFTVPPGKPPARRCVAR